MNTPPPLLMMPAPCRGKRGFSLLELIVTIAILSVLVIIGAAAAQRVITVQKETVCVSNLRTLSGGMISYIHDCNNIIRSMHSGGDVREMWVRKLLMGGYLNPAAERSDLFARENPILTTEIGLVGKYFRCPTGKIEASFLPYDTAPRRWLWQAYGMGMYAPEGVIDTVVDRQMGTTMHFKVAMAQLESLSGYILFADSANDAKDGYQSFKITKSAEHAGGIALRHRGMANAVFVDGHIERVDRKRAEALKIPKEKIHLLQE